MADESNGDELKEVQEQKENEVGSTKEERQDWVRHFMESPSFRQKSKEEWKNKERMFWAEDDNCDEDSRGLESSRQIPRDEQTQCRQENAGPSKSSSTSPTTVNGIPLVDGGTQKRKKPFTVQEVEVVPGPSTSSSLHSSDESPAAKRRALQSDYTPPQQSEDCPLSTPDIVTTASSTPLPEVERPQEPGTSMTTPAAAPRMRTKLLPLKKATDNEKDDEAASSSKEIDCVTLDDDDEEQTTSGNSAPVPVVPVPPVNNAVVTVANTDTRTAALRAYLEGIIREALNIHGDLPLDPERGAELEDDFPQDEPLGQRHMQELSNLQNVVFSKVRSAFEGFYEAVPGRQDSGDCIDKEKCSAETIAFMRFERSPLGTLRRRMGITSRRLVRMALRMSSFAFLSKEAKFRLLRDGITEMLCLYGFCATREFQQIAGRSKQEHLKFFSFFTTLKDSFDNDDLAIQLLSICVLFTRRKGLNRETGDRKIVKHLNKTYLKLFQRRLESINGADAATLVDSLKDVLKMLTRYAGSSMLLFLGSADAETTELVPREFFRRE